MEEVWKEFNNENWKFWNGNIGWRVEFVLIFEVLKILNEQMIKE